MRILVLCGSRHDAMREARTCTGPNVIVHNEPVVVKKGETEVLYVAMRNEQDADKLRGLRFDLVIEHASYNHERSYKSLVLIDIIRADGAAMRQPSHQPTPWSLIRMRYLFGMLLLQKAREHFYELFHKVELAGCDSHELPCWVWTGYGDGRYGHIWFYGQRFKVHRFVFFAMCGHLRAHEIVDHECNRTACCQPAHLCAATQSQNIKRCFAIGRGRSPLTRTQP